MKLTRSISQTEAQALVDAVQYALAMASAMVADADWCDGENENNADYDAAVMFQESMEEALVSVGVLSLKPKSPKLEQPMEPATVADPVFSAPAVDPLAGHPELFSKASE